MEYVPNAAEITWGITTYKEVHNILLFPDIYTRVSSISSVGHNVHIGYLASGGLGVSGHWGDNRSDNLGVSSARKRN